MLSDSKHKYKIIYADPPWKYNSRANHKTRFRGGAEGHYPLMDIKKIMALPVADISESNSVLFLWVTFPFLPVQLEVVKAWGFRYATMGFVWAKMNPKSGTPFFGVGYYSKSNAEACVLATRGKVMKPISNKVSSLIIAPRREHSRKPDEARERIEQLYGDVPRIELFAREQVPGWDSWGLDIGDGISISTRLDRNRGGCYDENVDAGRMSF